MLLIFILFAVFAGLALFTLISAAICKGSSSSFGLPFARVCSFSSSFELLFARVSCSSFKGLMPFIVIPAAICKAFHFLFSLVVPIARFSCSSYSLTLLFARVSCSPSSFWLPFEWFFALHLHSCCYLQGFLALHPRFDCHLPGFHALHLHYCCYLQGFHALHVGIRCYLQGFHAFRLGPLAAENLLENRQWTKQNSSGKHNIFRTPAPHKRIAPDNRTAQKLRMSQAPGTKMVGTPEGCAEGGCRTLWLSGSASEEWQE